MSTNPYYGQEGDGPYETIGIGNLELFPKVRIGDDVRAQHKLLTEKYGLKSLALVVGGSMGAQ